MSGEHTPGPWLTDGDTIYHQMIGDEHRIAEIVLVGNVARSEANARLIAAAPETAVERDRLSAEVGELEGDIAAQKKQYAALCAEKAELENTIDKADEHTSMLMTEIDRLKTEHSAAILAHINTNSELLHSCEKVNAEKAELVAALRGLFVVHGFRFGVEWDAARAALAKATATEGQCVAPTPAIN